MQKWEHEPFPPKSYQIGKFCSYAILKSFWPEGPATSQTSIVMVARASKGRSKLALDHSQVVLNPSAIV